MPLVNLLKSVFGLDSTDDEEPERRSHTGADGDAENEAVVKGTEEPAAAETEAAASTGSLTEEPPEDDEVASAAEPAEAAGPASQVDEPADEPAELEEEATHDEEDVEEETAHDEEEDAEAETHAEGSASITEEPPAEDEAAEPAEAAGAVTDHAGTEEAAAEPAEAAGPVDDEPDAGPDLTDVSGIGPAYAKRLEDAGVESVEELADSDAEALAEETGVSEKRVARWIENAEDA